MASKKRARKKAGKKKVTPGRKPIVEGERVLSFSVKFYEAEEFEQVRASAKQAGLSVSAWARQVLEDVAAGVPEDEMPAFMQKSIALTEVDRERIARGAAHARVSGQPAWLRYILLAAASGGEGSVLLRQLQRAVEVGEEMSKRG